MDGLFGLVLFFSYSCLCVKVYLAGKASPPPGSRKFCLRRYGRPGQGSYSTLPTQQTSVKIMPLEMFAPAQFLISIILGPF